MIEALGVMNDGGRRVAVVRLGKTDRMVGGADAGIGHIGEGRCHVGFKLTCELPAEVTLGVIQRREVKLRLVSDPGTQQS